MAVVPKGPPAARVHRARQPVSKTGAVAGAKTERRPHPAGAPAQGSIVAACVTAVPPIWRSLRSGRRHRADTEADALIVIDDFPRPVPIGRAEIDVLETYLGAALDEILREIGH